MEKTLYKSNSNRVIDGVCAGLAEYFNLDPTLIRVLWTCFLIVSFGMGIWFYFIAAICIPREPEHHG